MIYKDDDDEVKKKRRNITKRRIFIFSCAKLKLEVCDIRIFDDFLFKRLNFCI